MSESTVKIYARLRPLKPSHKSQSLKHSIEDNHVLFKFDKLKDTVNNTKLDFKFKFDKVFDFDAGQEEIFDTVNDVVTGALDGYNGTVFAYGQTGSGKTFTITGGPKRYEDRGLIPRTIQFIYKQIQKNSEFNYDIQISYLEIYNETGYDLLDTSRGAKSLDDLPKVTIQEDMDERMHIRNLSMVHANNEEEALNLLFIGDTNKMISETPSNPSSSRSHCLFIITITAKNISNDTVRRSKLHLVDLAGSERVSKTHIDGVLLKEAKYINLSLHYLEQVIISLHEKSVGKRSHIPYRNSMMTSLLRDSLGGNCRTCMVATLSVEENLLDESISTCRFAQRVALISNTISLNEETDPFLTIERLKKEIERLKAELSLAQQESTDEPLPDYEKERVATLIEAYIKGKGELLFGDMRKISHAFLTFKELVLKGGHTTSTSPNSDKLKQTIMQRDNEIVILLQKLKDVNPNKMTVQKSLPNINLERKSSPMEATRVPSAGKIIHKLPSTEMKYTEFQKSHSLYRESCFQKQQLQQKYKDAKALGEAAHILRSLIQNGQKEDVIHHIQDYKEKVEQLKELKSAIEHLQRGHERIKLKMLKDYDDRNEKLPEIEKVISAEEKLQPLTALNNECSKDALITTNDRADHQEYKMDLSKTPQAFESFINTYQQRDSSRMHESQILSHRFPFQQQKESTIHGLCNHFPRETFTIDREYPELKSQPSQFIGKKDVKAEIKAFYEARDRILG